MGPARLGRWSASVLLLLLGMLGEEGWGGRRDCCCHVCFDQPSPLLSSPLTLLPLPLPKNNKQQTTNNKQQTALATATAPRDITPITFATDAAVDLSDVAVDSDKRVSLNAVLPPLEDVEPDARLVYDCSVVDQANHAAAALLIKGTCKAGASIGVEFTAAGGAEYALKFSVQYSGDDGSSKVGLSAAISLVSFFCMVVRAVFVPPCTSLFSRFHIAN